MIMITVTRARALLVSLLCYRALVRRCLHVSLDEAIVNEIFEEYTAVYERVQYQYRCACVTS